MSINRKEAVLQPEFLTTAKEEVQVIWVTSVTPINSKALVKVHSLD